MNLLANLNVFVIAAYGLVMLSIGWFHQRQTTNDRPARSRTIWSVGLSLFASRISTLSYLAVPGQIIFALFMPRRLATAAYILSKNP